MNIFQTIKQETVSLRNKIAVIDGERNISYAQLISHVDIFAALLRRAGVCRFDRVGLLCRDSIEYITAGLAVLSVSAVVVPVAAEHTEAEISEILEGLEVNYLVFEKDAYNDEKAVRLESVDFFQKELYILNRSNKGEPEKEYYNINPAFIRFSSGTTGKSKGVVLSHRTIIERTSSADKGLHITSDDTVLWVLSMSYHFVVSILLFLRRAATIVICSRRFPESLLEGVRKHKGTFIYASPLHYNLLATSDMLSSAALENIRLAVSTAVKLPENIADIFYGKFGIHLSEAYGIIEVGLPFVNLSADKGRMDSVGKALPDYEIKIINKDTEGVGQIRIKGKGMLDAYFSPWQNRESLLDKGWFNTGDLGRIDEDGYLTIVGRDKDVINFAGMKVFPYEVESVINTYPGVKESYVCGERHPQYGHLPVAKIVLEEGLTKEMNFYDLRRFCYQRLTRYKVPKDFEFVQAISKTVSGKVKR